MKWLTAVMVLLLCCPAWGAFPVILFDSTDGAKSDTACSGAGPSTALTGSGDGEFTTTTNFQVPNQSFTGVAVDGSHLLFTQGGASQTRRYHKITAVNNAGTPTASVTVAEVGVAESGLNWAIGGVRATINHAESRGLIERSGAGDLRPGWAIELKSGHAETLTSSYDVNSATDGDATDGGIEFRGESGAATRPALSSSSSFQMTTRGDFWTWKDFDIITTGAADTMFTNVTTGGILSGIKCSVNGGSATYAIATSTSDHSTVLNCEVDGGAGDDITNGISADQNSAIINCYVTRCSDGIVRSGNIDGLLIYGNIIYDCADDGIDVNQTRSDAYAATLIMHNTIDSCGGDGIQYSGNSASVASFSCFNNIFSNNTGYGLNIVTMTGLTVKGRGFRAFNNAFYSNTAGPHLPTDLESVGASVNQVTTDPTYTAAASGDFRIGTNLKAKGLPLTGIGLTDTTSFVDIGAAQRVEPAAGGGQNANQAVAVGF